MTLVTIALVAAVAATTPHAEKPAHMGSLDGMTFEVTLVKPDGSDQGPDTLVFRDGTFDSMDGHAYNFGKAPYTTRPEAASAKEGSRGATMFESTMKSATDGTDVWNGRVAGQQISGTLTWTDAKGKVTVLTFHGQEAKPDMNHAAHSKSTSPKKGR